MVDGRRDAELVAAHLAGDSIGLAGIYDRYADPLYDTAAYMLHDRDEAADVVQDVFVKAAEKLGQLRDPDKLKPWLFAVLRHEVYRRTKRRQRVRPLDPTTAAEVVAPNDTATDGLGTVDLEELARSVREAAAGLDARDQLVLELTARQGLEGDDLAQALGVGLGHSHVLVHRMRERVERSLGALAVARTGRKDCPELDALLAGWDGELTVLVRKRVSRHVENCSVCSDTKRRYAAIALVGAAPALAAPPELRPRVLARVGPPMAPRRWPAVVAGVAAATLLATGAGVGLAVLSSDEAAAPAPESTDAATTTAGPATSTTAAPSTTVAPATSTTVTTVASTTTDPPTTTAAPTTTIAPALPGRLDLSTDVIDLGATESSGRIVLANGGGTTIEWVLQTGEPFAWSGTGGQLDPDEAVELTVSLDRDQLPEGDIEEVASIGSDVGSGEIVVLARVERSPVVEIIRAPTTVPCRTTVTPVVAATIDDESELVDVTLEWSGPGDDGETGMTTDGNRGWIGPLELDPVPGTWRYTLTATDARGNSGEAAGEVVFCP